MAEHQLNAETEPSALRWVMVGLIFLATVINYLCRQAYSVSATTLQQVFSLSNADYGLLTSGFFFAYALSNGVSGPIIDRLGAKLGYLLCMFLWSSAVGLIGTAQNVWMLAGFLMLLGLGEAGNWPAAVKVVGEWFSPRERSLASGIFNSGAGIGALVGPTAVGLLLIHFGWRPAFVIVGLIGYLWMIGFALVYRTPATVAAEVAARPPSPWRLLKTRFLLFFALSKLFMDPVWYFYVFWLPKFLTDVHHFNLKQIVWLAPIPFIIADIGNLAGGGFTQLLISRGIPIPYARKIGAAVFGLLMVSGIPAIITHDPYVSIALVSIAMFGYTGYLANTLAFPAEVFPKNALGSIWGLASMGSGLGGMFFQWLLKTPIQGLIRRACLQICLLGVALPVTFAADLNWIQSARVFLIDAYQPPFAPKLEYHAEALARTMAGMHANTVRISTMGKYATIQGVRFSTYPELGARDVLAETIAACKPRGIRTVAYISTGHKLAWSMVTQDYPEYAQRVRPGGGPNRDHMFVGEDHGTVCWNTPYRKAFLDLVEHVVRDYAVDGLYFDTWRPFYFWPGLKVCYCDGCRNGFQRASGKAIPWHEREGDYTKQDHEVIAEYHQWYHEELMSVLEQVRRLVKAHKDIPLIYNLNNADNIASEDPRILKAMDAFLYERGPSLLERAEGVSLARAAGLGVWPYVGVYNNWPRVIPNGLDYQQEIFTTAAFGGAPIIAQPYAYVTQAENRRWVSRPFSVLKDHERELQGVENVPYIAVVQATRNPPGHAQSGWFWSADVRSSTLGAFAACLYGHVQVSSVSQTLLDEPEKLARYRVLYLADIPQLTSRRRENLERFVENGGGLLACYGTSLYGAAGERLERFELESLLRVRPVHPQGELAETLNSYRCMMGGPDDLYLTPHAVTDAPLVPLGYFEPVEVLEGGSTMMDIVTGDGRRPILPGVVTSTHGQGRAVYLASSLESLYRTTKESALGSFLRNLVEHAAAMPPPYQVTAPSSLIVNLTQNGNRRVLHLLNWTTEPDNESGYLPPIENVGVRLRIPEGRQARQIRGFPETSFRHKQSGEELEFRFPRIDAYEGIAFELQ